MRGAGDALRALPWSLEIPLDGSNSRHVLIRIAKESAIPPYLLQEAGAELPTDFGVFYAHSKRLARECDLSLRTVRRIVKSLVACGVLLREKDPHFLVEQGLIRAKTFNLPIAYYANTRIDGRDAAWVREASCVALNIITQCPSTKKTPSGATMGDYPTDLVDAMRVLVPAEVWPDGFGPEDALSRLEAVPDMRDADPRPSEDPVDSGILNDHSKRGPEPDGDDGWSCAVIPEGPLTTLNTGDAQQPELPGADVHDLTARVAAREAKQAKLEDQAHTERERNKQINAVLWECRRRREAAGKKVPRAGSNDDKVWWRTMRAMVKKMHLDDIPDDIIIDAWVSLDQVSPLEWQVRKNLPSRYQARLAQHPARGAAINAANSGAGGIDDGGAVDTDAIMTMFDLRGDS